MNTLASNWKRFAAVLIFISLFAAARADYYFYFQQNTGSQSDHIGVADIGDYIGMGPWAPATALFIGWPYQLTVVVDTNVAKGTYQVGTVQNFSNTENVYVVIQ